MRCLELKDGPKEDTEGEQRGAGAAAAGVGGALSEKRETEFGERQRGGEYGEIQMDVTHLVFRSCTELLIEWPDY